MNVYDSERMTDILAPLGYAAADVPDDADLVILNTCHIREKAAEKIYSELGRLRQAKSRRERAGLTMTIAVAGCVAQAEGGEIVRRAPFVDMVFGPQTYHRLPEMMARVHRTSDVVMDTDFPTESKFDQLPAQSAPAGVAAFVTVQEGCDKFCTFCVVPYTRGAEFSRPIGQVLAEVGHLVHSGMHEITLLGQNVNAYHGAAEDGREWNLARLIVELARIKGLQRIRYTTSYPADMDDDLIAAHRDVPELMPFLHMPVQSGSDRVLQAMNRRHSANDYRRLVDRLRRARSDIAMSSDFIVGFPGETDADFSETMALVRDIGFSQAYSFKFSPRPGTQAAIDERQVPDAVKTERLDALQTALNAGQIAYNKCCIGRTMPVLFDRLGRHPGQLVGRSPYMQAVHVKAPPTMFGDVVDVRIVRAYANSLGGELAKIDERASYHESPSS